MRLTVERDNREGLNLFRIDGENQTQEEISISASDRFVIMPGEKGKDWIIRVYHPVPEPPPTPDISS